MHLHEVSGGRGCFATTILKLVDEVGWGNSGMEGGSMYQYAVSLESIFVDAKAMNEDYLDRLLMTVNLEHHIRSTPETTERAIVAKKSGLLGYYGSGQVVNVRSLVTGDGTPWFFEIPELDPNADLRLRVEINNVRGLEDKHVERLISQLTVLAGEITAGALIHAPSKAAELGLDIGLGIAGFGLDKLIDEIFVDPPNCAGLVYDEDIPLFREILASGVQYVKAEDDSGFTEQGSATLAADGRSPGADCGHFSARVRYRLHRRQIYDVPFGKPTKKERSEYIAVDSLRANDSLGNWTDERSPAHDKAVAVLISPHGGDGERGVDIAVREVLSDEKGRKKVVVEQKLEDSRIEWARCLRPLRESILGVPKQQSLIGGLKYADKIGLLLKKPGALPPGGGGKLPKGIEQIRLLPAEAELADAAPELTTETARIRVSDDLWLCFWRERFSSGRVTDLMMRYTRDSNSTASATDTWMLRFTKFG
jgi:hypothetical protein